MSDAKKMAALARQEAARGKQAAGRGRVAASGPSAREHRLGVRITGEANELLSALLYSHPGASVADIIEAAIGALARERKADLRQPPTSFTPKKGRPYTRQG